jgi:outer membrane protein OmpA-like peptidoglycan-associated protein
MNRLDLSCPSLARRHGLGVAVTALALALTGCATPPPPPPPAPPPRFSAAQVTALRDLGFVEVAEGWELNLAGKVLFSFNEQNLDAGSARAVATIADTLLKADLTRLRIEGHTDNVGEAEYNRRLSMRRAEMVARDLAARGLPMAHMEIRGQGMNLPIADNATEAGRAQNRRVTILVRGD